MPRIEGSPYDGPLRRPLLTRSQSDIFSGAQVSKPTTNGTDKHDVPTFTLQKDGAVEQQSPNAHSVLVSPNAAIAPQRPPRNPARTQALPASSVAPPKKRSSRPSTATGTREEITPWEFYPVPAEYTSQAPRRSSMRPSTAGNHGTNRGIPSFSDLPLVRRRKSASKQSLSNAIPIVTPINPPPHHSSHVLTKSPPPNHKSKQQRNSSFHPQPPPPMQPQSLPPPLRPVIVTDIPISAPDAKTISPPRSPTSKVQPLKDLPSPPSRDPPRIAQNLKFSTADRTILEELKRSIMAKASQFVIKGPNLALHMDATYLGWGAQGLGTGKKHHPYAKEEVPYPRNYEREVLDLDAWETVCCQQMCGSMTYHAFETAPVKVLDIGCGTGTWVLKCAQVWKNTHFVGLDVVPLHPDLQQVGSVDLASRITWVQANFLECLPFPNEEFDFVHIKRISLGVPEDKWDALFEEITRVMKPGGAFELIEEDLFFPGKALDDDASSDTDYGSQSAPQGPVQTRRYSTSSFPERESLDIETLFPGSAESRSDPYSSGRPSDEIRPPSSGDASPLTASPKVSHFKMLNGLQGDSSEIIEEDKEGELDQPPPQSDARQPLAPITPATDSNNAPGPVQNLRTLLKSPSMVNLHALRNSIPTSPTSGKSANLPPIRISPNGNHSTRPKSQGKFADSTEWLMNSLAAQNQSSNFRESKFSLIKTRPSSIISRRGSMNGGSPAPASPTTLVNDFSSLRPPLLLRTMPKPPANPRDHSLLEYIYDEMLASRFINTSPLSLLANLVGLHFRDVRTHPPLMMKFPPPLPKIQPISREDFDPDEDARDAIVPNPSKRSKSIIAPDSDPNTPTPKPMKDVADYFGEAKEEPATGSDDQFLSIRRLIRGTSPYVTLDDSRINAFSPSTKANFPSPTASKFIFKNGDDAALLTPTGEAPTKEAAKYAMFSMRKNRLPNTTLNVDLRALNLHLALRVQEIMACSESMWDWIVQVKKENRPRHADPPTKAPTRPGSSSGGADLLKAQRQALATFASANSIMKDAVLELGREDFEHLLSNFFMDMQDQMSIGSALNDRFNWPMPPSSPTNDRKMFENEYNQWLQWEQEKHPPRRSSLLQEDRGQSLDVPDDLTLISERRKSVDHRHEMLMDRGRPSLTSSNGNRSTSQISRTSSSSGSQNLPPPTKRLSRSFRVFCGWKPSS